MVVAHEDRGVLRRLFGLTPGAALGDNLSHPLYERRRLSLPVMFGQRHVAPLLPGFLKLHPQVSVEVGLTDRQVRLIEDGVDIAVREHEDHVRARTGHDRRQVPQPYAPEPRNGLVPAVLLRLEPVERELLLDPVGCARGAAEEWVSGWPGATSPGPCTPARWWGWR